MMSKEEKYTDYLTSHMHQVNHIWEGLRELVTTQFDELITLGTRLKTTQNVSLHDRSKFSVEEWGPYLEKFYGDKPNSPETQEAFDKAWLLHQRRNPHHWQYWVLIEDGGNIKPLPMPLEYILEMLCDWGSMSYKFDNIPSKWYNSNKSKMKLHPGTRDMVEDLLPLLDVVVSNYQERGETYAS